MTLARAFRFPLFSLAAQNVGQRRARAVLLGLAIMLAVGVGYASWLMVKRGPRVRPQASEGEAQHGPFCWIGRFGQGDQRLHCG